MNFEDIQSLWTGQVPAPPHTPQLLKRQRMLLSEFKRRSRMLGYEAFGIAFGLIATPFLSVVNYLYRPSSGTFLSWTSAVLHTGVLITAAAFVFRRTRRHRELGRVCISTLRDQAEVSLANLKAELHDYRWAPWMLVVWGLLTILSIVSNSAFHGGSWQAVTLRVGLTLGFLGVVGAVLWRHYRVNLHPAYVRQQEILRQMD